MERLNVMIVEDEMIVAEDIRKHLEGMGYGITSVHADGEGAVGAARTDAPDLVLMDVKLRGAMDGIEAARRIKQEADRPVVFLTSYSDDGILEKAEAAEAYGYLLKPFDDRELHTTIRMAVHRHRMEGLVRAAKRQWEQTFDTMPDLVALVGHDYRITRVNRSLADALGRSPDDLIGARCYDAIDGRREPPDDCPHRQLLEDAQSHGCEMRLDRPGGVFHVTASPLTDDRGDLVGSVHVARDITKRRKMELELERSRSFLQNVIDGVGDAVVVVGKDYRIRMMNNVARGAGPDPQERSDRCYERCHGREEPCNGEEHPCPLEQVLETRGPVVVTHRHRRDNGTFFPVEIVATPLLDPGGDFQGIIEVARDVSERERLEAERRDLDQRRFEIRRNESVVTLAGGIAHEFNNILTTVMGSAELLRDKRRGVAERDQLLDAIRGSGERMADLTRQLLAYAGGGKYAPGPVGLQPIASRALDRGLQGRNRDHIQVELLAAPDLWPVYGDPRQIEQVLDHLVGNALESMEDMGGRLRLSLENEFHEGQWVCDEKDSHSGGGYVRISVEDEGSGIPAEFRNRIFDPFFSTKFMGRGLGLAAVRGIVGNHGGCISFRSTPGRGTTLAVRLPRAAEPGAAVAPIPVPGAARVVLLVDDEPEILQLLENLLRDVGYGVLKAGDGLEAIGLIEQHGDTIGMTVLDIHLPKAGGRRVFERLRELLPGLPVIITSGHAEATALSGIRLGPGDAFLPKPFHLEQVLDLVTSRLGEPGTD